MKAMHLRISPAINKKNHFVYYILVFDSDTGFSDVSESINVDQSLHVQHKYMNLNFTWIKKQSHGKEISSMPSNYWRTVFSYSPRSFKFWIHLKMQQLNQSPHQFLRRFEKGRFRSRNFNFSLNNMTANGTAILETTINENSTEVATTNAGYIAKKWC